MLDIIEKLQKEALEKIKSAETKEILNELRVAYLGKKGELTALLKNMKNVAPEDRAEFGKVVNEAREAIENTLNTVGNELAKLALEARLKSETIDVTLPANRREFGHSHPNIIALHEVEKIFTKLNIPEDHPAKDEQDTFYITKDIVLRTQTSPVQARTMETGKIPIKMISPGRVYRSDEVDATHSPTFNQIEGLIVDKGITFADLKGTLEVFAKKLFGEDTKVKFRPHHFPFTEPSAEMDVTCFKCHGSGCRFCKGSGWIEILGCGMVHPHVFDMCGVDKNEYNGFAFGIGLERIALLKYEIDDMRLLYENDIRFLKQFK